MCLTLLFCIQTAGRSMVLAWGVMMEKSRKMMTMTGMLFGLFVVFGSMMQICSAESETIFLETIDENFDGRWVISEKEDYKGEGVISDLNRVVRILRFDVAC